MRHFSILDNARPMLVRCSFDARSTSRSTSRSMSHLEIGCSLLGCSLLGCSLLGCTHAHALIRTYSSEFVSVRQRSSAFVSVRQRSSAYTVAIMAISKLQCTRVYKCTSVQVYKCTREYKSVQECTLEGTLEGTRFL